MTITKSNEGVRLKVVEAKTCAPPEPSEETLDLRPVEGEQADAELAEFAKALGHPARVQIMRDLVRRSACVCGDIVDVLPLAQSTVSLHLKDVFPAPEGRGADSGRNLRTCYCVEPRALRRLKALIGSL